MRDVTIAVQLREDVEEESGLLEYLRSASADDVKETILLGHYVKQRVNISLTSARAERELGQLKDELRDVTARYESLQRDIASVVSDVDRERHAQYQADLAVAKSYFSEQLRQQALTFDAEQRRARDAFAAELHALHELSAKNLENYDRLLREIQPHHELHELKAALLESLNGLRSNAVDRELGELRGQLVAKEMEIARLRQSNHVKGVAGETLVLRMLADAFDTASFRDASSHGAQSDVHMTLPDTGETVVFEVKNKSSITVQDVDKSLRDVRELTGSLGPKFLAYVFVSLRCNSIPRKGSFVVERIGRVPVVWLGYDLSQAELENPKNRIQDDLVRTTKMLVRFARILAACDAADADSDTSRNLKNHVVSIKASFETLAKSKKACIHANEALQSLRRHLQIMDESHDVAMKNLERLLELLDPASHATETATTSRNTSRNTSINTSEAECSDQSMTCPRCQRSFASKRGVVRHLQYCTM